MTVTNDPVARPRIWSAVLGVAVLAQTVAAMDNSVLNLAAKTLADPVAGLDASTGELAWTISAYTVVYAAAMFAGGALADRFGPRWALCTGLAVFMVTSTLAAFSVTPLELVLCRGGMGVGAALITPATLSIALRASEPAQRPKAVAIWASAAAVGIAIGPVVGGLLLSRLWWGSVFLLNLPVSLICLVGIGLWVPRLHVEQRRSLDWPGLVLSFGGLLGVVYGVIQIGGDIGWNSPSVLLPLVAGLALLAVFAVQQSRSRAPSFDVRLFLRRRFAGGGLVLTVAFFGITGQLFYASFYLQDVLGLSPLGAGLAIAPTAIGILAGNLWAPALVRRFSVRKVASVGMVVTIATLASYLVFDASTPVAVFGLMMLVQGFSMGTVVVPATTAAMDDLPSDRSGAGSAVTSGLRQLGGTLGIAVGSTILSAWYRSGLGPALSGLPDDLARQAVGSVQAALSVARTAGRPELVEAATSAYLHAMRVTAGVSAVLCLSGLVLIAACLGGKSD
ncbi:MFS transporter [Kutzneria sp. NPDC051319]|uniref:MFS transporter n=1 Tax=Kutzneria sp. NPDC051319 TaxID=3155047 RepID=UPI00341AA01A